MIMIDKLLADIIGKGERALVFSVSFSLCTPVVYIFNNACLAIHQVRMFVDPALANVVIDPS